MNSQVKKIGYVWMLVLLCVWWMGQAEGGGGDTKSLVGWLKSMSSGLKARMLGVEQKMGVLKKQLANVQTVSKIAKARAESAEIQAGKAKKRADSAETNANSAKKRADSAEVNANDAKKRADSAEAKASSANARADSAEANANSAKTRANEAETEAKDAKTKAHSAEQRAESAESQAKEAKRRAEAAKAQATFALWRARTAERRAIVAEEKADEAQKKADEAQKKGAELAQSVAGLERQLQEKIRAFQAYKESLEEQIRRIGGAGRSFWLKGVLFKTRWIPTGSFVMGSPDGDSEAQGDEKPQRSVTLTHGFWMMETEVTQAQYKAVMGENPSKHTSCSDDCPVESVSWHDAALFANKLSEIAQLSRCFDCKGEGSKAFCGTHGNKGSDYIGCKGWRLPTEAEWEYAARAGTSTSRYGAADAIGWYNGNSGGKTQPVWKKQPNAWGLYDMLGNVWEWVYDGYDNSAYTKLGAVDPVYVAAASFRVFRGGSWYDDVLYSRATFRNRNVSTEANSNLGFRLVRR